MTAVAVNAVTAQDANLTSYVGGALVNGYGERYRITEARHLTSYPATEPELHYLMTGPGLSSSGHYMTARYAMSLVASGALRFEAAPVA